MNGYRLDQLKRELAGMDAKRDALIRLIQAIEEYEERVGTTTQIGNNVTVHHTPAKREQVAAARGPTVMDVTEGVALELIEESGAPTTTREVVRVMTERSLPLPTKNVTNVISARLSNSSKLEGRRGFGWWPKGRPWPGEENEMFSGEAVAQEEEKAA